MDDTVYTDEQLGIIEDMASIFMPVDDIASYIDVRPECLRRDIKRNSRARKAYNKGKLLSKIELHRQEMQLAKSGSPLGIEAVIRHLQNMEENEIK